jgi:hypothetical protein
VVGQFVVKGGGNGLFTAEAAEVRRGAAERRRGSGRAGVFDACD